VARPAAERRSPGGGARGAMTMINDGDMVEIDADAGIVRVAAAAP
jgi:dihydroxyacid dehydratase/phosphogluconate dehydratase